MPSLGFILLTVSEKKNFEHFFRKFTLYVAPSTNQIKGFGQKFYETMEDYSINISVKKKTNISSETAETQFPLFLL